MKINLLSRPCRSKKDIIMVLLLLFVSSVSFAQNKVYVNSQTNAVSGLCVNCSVTNPQNAIGNNENDYSTIKVPLSLLGANVTQTLIFPEAVAGNFRKVIIGIGAKNSEISVGLLKKMEIETFLGNVSNGDAKKIDDTMLNIDPGTKRGTIEFIPKKRFDRVRVKLDGGLLDLNDELRIYYAYYFTSCGLPPFNPSYYYSFNGNINESISGFNFTSYPIYPNSPDYSPLYQNNLICEQGLATSSPDKDIKLYIEQIPPALKTGDITVSFWAHMDAGILRLMAFGAVLELFSGYAVLNNDPNPFRYPMNGDKLQHFVLVYSGNNICMYLDGWPIIINSSPASYCREWDPVKRSNMDFIKLSLTQGKMDELVIYNRKLTEDEIQDLNCSYGTNMVFCNRRASKTSSNVVSAEEGVFNVSPNPTSGQITLDGNIPLEGSEISISNISGKEVYRSAFRTKTFELPDVLPGGIYILNLQTKEGKIFSRKIILSR
ncbi:T9SS type A sorting domain-containing protein [Chryseobacterium sp. c4a]|uniref:T9SS type A sorting domain-containing protein n=1 Tax=Chryseobacterium sp. c4a TaxID=1573582 RepID=UPI001358B5C8|nr:T9SS type A sorting domain-containing protein [Chryseobacterium sp. c4a]